MAYFNLSLSDLMLLDSWRTAAKGEDQKEMYRVLYSNGLDITKPFNYELCTHRNLQGKEITGERIVGVERNDAFWISTGAASEQAKLEYRGGKDGSMYRQLDSMNASPLRSAEGMYDSKDYDIS